MKNKEKEIEEMSREICSEYDCVIPCQSCGYYGYANCRDVQSAEKLYNAGYRKASDVFEEIEREIKLALVSNHKAKRDHLEKHYYCLHSEFLSAVQGKIDALRGIEAFIAELKKKYINK